MSPTLLASSSTRRPQMSITLPRNFAPLSLDGNSDPKTPDQTFAEPSLPAGPQHSTVRVRRVRPNMASFQKRNNALLPTLFASDIPMPSSAQRSQPDFQMSSETVSPDDPVPSVEVPPSFGRPLFQHSNTEPSPSERLCLPAFAEQLPRTPPAQTSTTPAEYKRSVWEMRRTDSECSFRSDSSFSSAETLTTRPTSFNGSLTSPFSENTDPFSGSFSPQQKVNIIPDTPTRRNKKIKVEKSRSKDDAFFTIEMDNHLFNVYQMYLADPSVTPFKTLPGSAPPTGVCHRVARRAKETWRKASRFSKPIIQRYKLRNVFEDRGLSRAKTPEPYDFLKTDNRGDREPWPSESATRRRLKKLCREKFTISAHYQRLRESRSPSPFHEQFQKRPAPRLTRSMSHQMVNDQNAASYATRELGISLVASGATAPLAQLVTGDSPPAEQHSDDFFNTPINSSSERMNISPPSGLGIQQGVQNEPQRLGVANDIPRLASPFAYSTWNGPSRPHRRHISSNQFDTMHATGSRLLSPFQPGQDTSKVTKRRALHNLEDELSPRGSSLEPDLSGATLTEQPTQELAFTGVGDITQRRIRLRSRGATLGAVNHREQIQRLFSPPSLQNPTNDVPAVPGLPPTLTALAGPSNRRGLGSLALPETDANQKRLGSPFELDPNKRSYRATAPRHVASLSDPFLNTSGTSINERLAEFAQLRRRDDDPFV